MIEFLKAANKIVWGAPALILILGVGLYLSIRTGFVQFRLLPKAFRIFKRSLLGNQNAKNGSTQYQALCTALAATVGTGNLAGVAGAIALGGPGAIFWMWVCAVFGMVTKFAEATLAIRYRSVNSDGEYIGGPMYMIRNGMGKRWRILAGIYCFFGVTASLGVGNATQINAVIGGINSIIAVFGGHESFLVDLIIGISLAILITAMLTGGARKISLAAERLVPLASVAYLVLGSLVLILRFDRIPEALTAIVRGAFTPSAVTGGMVGSAFMALRVGASRGVFTNEAGMGTASIAHAAAQVKHPVEQGLMGVMEVFLDTIVICTMTALVILCSGVPIPYGMDTGIVLTSESFSDVLGPWVHVPIALALCCFAVGTVLGWSLYGIRCAQYLFGERVWKGFAYGQGFMVTIGAIMGTGTVWILAETVNGLMAIPNLIALAYLTPELVKLSREYEKGPT